MDIVLEIDGVRYKHVPSEDKSYCMGCKLSDLCYEASWLMNACAYLDAEEGIGKFIKA